MFQQERVLNRDHFRNVFRNIGQIIDCVLCENANYTQKLRVQVLGLGTALKVLFKKDILSADMFESNEILALIVTLGKYSDALQFIEEMERQIEIKEMKANIQGYVDIDKQLKQQQQERNEEKQASDQLLEFDKLIEST